MKKWKIIQQDEGKQKSHSIDEIVSILLNNRGFQNKKDRENFLNTSITDVNLDTSQIDKKEFAKFEKRILRAIDKNEKIIIFGDYDVDGICASAILWETIFAKTKNVFPYIPDRVDEGYGLSKKGIDNVLLKHPEVSLIITVDNGIVAYEAIEYAKVKGIDVIVTDHHVKGEKMPAAFCILHTTLLCGAGIAWVIAKELGYESNEQVMDKLELAALATVADLVPLVGNNRAIVKYGLEKIKHTKRLGLQEILKEAGADKNSISVYTIGHQIAPRLNASGRIHSAMDALRLLCTKSATKANSLALQLGNVNRDRQGLTEESVNHAKLLALESSFNTKVIVVADASYNQGIIGLVASQLVELHYKPSFAIAKGEKISKGSARSIQGVNVIELLRSVSATLVEVGGHPMAAGFSIETHRIEEFTKALALKAEEVVTAEFLERTLTIDMILGFGVITKDLVVELNMLEPFGMANPEPVFATKDVDILEIRKIGREQNHLKMKLSKDGKVFDAIAFKMADTHDLSEGDIIDIAYTVDENEWNGRKSLQLKIRDIKSS